VTLDCHPSRATSLLGKRLDERGCFLLFCMPFAQDLPIYLLLRCYRTPFWLAPEYLRGQTKYTEACDLYSVGIILYEIYSRHSPYEGEDFREVLRKVCDRRINKRPVIPTQTPPKLAELMKKLWSPDSSFRPKAKDLDMTLMDLATSDAEPVEAGAVAKRTTSDMLYEIFPRRVADALKNGQKVNPEDHENVTIVFSDIVRFTDISRELTPLKVSHMLDRLYLAFDSIARKHQVFKVETIGDAYMGVTNLENNMDHTHARNIAEFAVDMINEANKILIDEEEPSKGYINIRVGFHSGPVVSNVIGSLNPRYGLFGDTVNTANRMESNSKENRILCSEKAYKLLVEQAPDMPTRKRGKVAVKGKGEMTVYWVGTSLIKANAAKTGRSRGDVQPLQLERRVGFDDDNSEHVDLQDMPTGGPAVPSHIVALNDQLTFGDEPVDSFGEHDAFQPIEQLTGTDPQLFL
jgi:class 3 adenylate cyclase